MKDPRNIPGILISNVSFPKLLEEDVSSGNKCSELMLPFLVKSVSQLEKAGADFIVLPCNTLHSLLPKLRENTSGKFIDLIEEVSKKVQKDGLKKVGILSTTRTRKDKLYDDVLKGTNLIYPSEEEQKELSGIIIRIIRKSATIKDKEFLDELAGRLIERGAEKVILACTDLANLAKANKNIIDSTQILIDSVSRMSV